MKIVNVIQGSDEWNAHRAGCFNASDAPAMLGISPHKTRTQLLEEYATGIVQEFDDVTLSRFADGHRFEALARPIAEEIVGEDLYPIIATEDYGLSRLLSASSDGMTLAYDKNFEHKSLNNDLREVFDNELPLSELYTSQMEQQHMVFGCDETLFMASKFDDNDELLERRERTYKSDSAMRNRIIAGWKQFEIDLANYKPRAIAEKPNAEVTIDLPALFVHAKGEITTNNMAEFGNALKAKLEEVRSIVLLTDQDFSNAKAAAKQFRETAKAIMLTEKQMLAQTETIGEASLEMKAWVKDLNATALQLEKDVEREDLTKKRGMIYEAVVVYGEHIAALEAEISPIRISVPIPDFVGAIKGKSKYSNMQNAIDTALANGKIAADAQAKDYRAKLDWYKANTDGFVALFPDLATIITKPTDDFVLTVTSRIDKQKADDAAKLEAQRVAMQAEADRKAKEQAEAEIAKAKAEQEAIHAAEIAKVQAEERAKAQSEAAAARAKSAEEAKNKADIEAARIRAEEQAKAQVEVKRAAAISAPAVKEAVCKSSTPTDDAIIQCVAAHFGVSYGTACDWILKMAERMELSA